MKFIMVSKFGDGAGLLSFISREDNEVELYITERKDRDSWEGLIPKVETLPLEKDAVYIFDMVGNGDIADSLIRRGYYVFGGSSLADNLENRRGDAIDVMSDAGMTIPETHTFNKFEDAITFVGKSKKRWVLKVSGKELPCSLSYCPSEGEDSEFFVRYMLWVQDTYGKKITEIELQEFKEGVAVSTEGWFNGFHFVRPFNHTIENKKFLNKGLGPATGCEGNVVWSCDEDALTDELKKMEPYLQGKYKGPFDLNCIISEEGIFPLEFTPRFGYDSTCTYRMLFEGDIGKIISDIAHGTYDGEMEQSVDFCSALRVSIPPYPNEGEIDSGLPIEGIDWEDIESYYFYEVSECEGNLVHCGSGGVVLATLGSNYDLGNALDITLKLADELKIPNKQYRTDLIDVIYPDYQEFSEVIVNARTRS